MVLEMILDKLKEQDKELRDIKEQLSEQNLSNQLAISAIRFKLSVWGAFAGGASGLITALIALSQYFSRNLPVPH